MHEIRRYCDLDPGERQHLFDFTFAHDPERFPDVKGMEQAYMSGAFEHGASQFSRWQDGRVIGAMGAVVREAELRGEIFVTAVAIEHGHEDGFAPLLEAAFACMPAVAGRIVRMGIARHHDHVAELAGHNGFRQDYDGLIMTYQPHEFDLPADPAWRLEIACEANAEPYRWVLDDAFRYSPNGATVDAEQIAELLAEISHPDLLGLAWWGDQPAAAFELSLQGDTGWIEAIAVARPLQGKGFGKRMLAAALARLEGHGVKEIKLLVMSTNAPAVKLYRTHGFGQEHITTRWWRLA